ncbi:conserved hypothetical protein [uncultured Desulfobacterium sp.]|uniref:DUF1015 domain-containing protein n=1 Tax=uncultured Desulfobacterium sp. TaxID=201089 RepID=A0A445MRI4_9BACT|nr:conserved hypothetical protein [uncultured Desulfobacterium sp.]
MAVIVPFRGMTYNFHSLHDMPLLVTPPYDVISEREQEEFYRAHPHNIIRLILGKRKIGDTDWDNRYTRAADTFKRWESEGILVRSQEPCIYLTSHTYDPGEGKPLRTRWGIIVLVRIEDEGSGVILPHEQTFSAHKDDRLRLISACNAQFSQIFGLYEDPSDTIVGECKKEADSQAKVSFDFKDGTRHQMWILDSHSLFKKVAQVMADKPIFIADGHHRYETSRNFRDIMRKRHGRRHVNRSYEYVMMYLSNMDNEGLTILPSHRLIKNAPVFDLKSFLDILKRWFNLTEVPFKGLSISEECLNLKKRMEEGGNGGTDIAFFAKEAGQFYILSLKAGARDEMGADLHPALKKLDVLVLSILVFEMALGFDKGQMDNSDIFHYNSNMEETVSAVISGNYRMAFLLNPTRIEHVKEIAQNSLVMPRKSTFFYPKVLTGLVLNKIDPNETVNFF